MDPTDWQLHSPETMEKPSLIQDQDEIPGKIQRMNVPRCGYYSVKDNKRPHTMMGTNDDLERHTPSSDRHNMSYRLNSNNLNPEMVTSSDPDSEPEELSEIDKELARKRRELKEIEKQILCKKTTTIAMKTTTGPPLKSILKAKTPCQMTTTTEPPLKSILKAKTPCQMMFKEDREEDLSSKVDSSVRNTLPFMNTGEKDEGFSCSKQPSSSAYSNRTLKERVDGIVQRRKAWRDYCTTTFDTPTDHLPPPNPVEKTSLSTLNKDDHPLKLRMKALMNRHRNSGLLDSHGEIPVKPQPPSQSPTTTVEENNSTVNGFQRFLSVLNKGVDIEMLNKILIDHNEHPPTAQGLLHSSQTPVVKEKAGVCESDSQRDCHPRSEERKNELLNQHISNEGCKINFQREEKSAQSDDRGDHHFGSSRRSRSPPVVEEKKPKLEQHQGDLQNILKMIGFSMDADDMCKLAERTQKRLYGMKNETELRSNGTALSKRSPQHVRSDHSRYSSSTSVSDRPSSSPSHHQHSPSKTSRDSRKQTQCSEYGLHFRQRSRERGRERDGDKNIIVSRDGSTARHQYLENPEYLVTYPDAMYNSNAASAIPSYTSVRHSEYSTYHSGLRPLPRNLHINPQCQTKLTDMKIQTKQPAEQIHGQESSNGKKELDTTEQNSDLSLSEGQTGRRQSDLCYLHIINTVQHSEYTDYHRDTSNGPSSAAWNDVSNDNPPSSSCPPGLCNSIIPVRPSADTGALLGQVYPHPPAGYNDAPGHSCLNSDLSLTETEGLQGQQLTTLHCTDYIATMSALHRRVLRPVSGQSFPNLKKELKYIRKWIARTDCDWLPNSKWLQEQIAAKEKDILMILNPDRSLIEGQDRYIYHIAPVYRQVLRSVKGRPFSWLHAELKRVRQWIARANIDTKHNYEYLKKRLAAKEQYILMILNPSSDLSLIEGQTGQQSAVNNNPISVCSLKKKKNWQPRAQLRAAHMEEIKNEIEEIKANLTKEVAGVVKSDLSLSEGQTGQQSAINPPSIYVKWKIKRLRCIHANPLYSSLKLSLRHHQRQCGACGTIAARESTIPE